MPRRTPNQARPALTLRRERLPLQPAVGALQGAVDVVVTAVAGARVRLGERQLVVDVGVPAAQPPAARRAGAAGVLVTKPTLHLPHLGAGNQGGSSGCVTAARGRQPAWANRR